MIVDFLGKILRNDRLPFAVVNGYFIFIISFLADKAVSVSTSIIS